MHFATRAIHASQPSDPSTGALIAPIYQTSTFEQESPGVHLGFDYSRTHNPTRARLEAVLAELEGVNLCDPGVSAALHARRRCRGAQRHEVSRRSFRSDPRGGARKGRRGVRADQIPAKRDRRSAGAAGLLVDAARSQDAGAARLASRRECGAHRRRARRPSPRASCVLPRPRHAPRTRRGAPPNERVRRDAVV